MPMVKCKSMPIINLRGLGSGLRLTSFLKKPLIILKICNRNNRKIRLGLGLTSFQKNKKYIHGTNQLSWKTCIFF